MHSSVPLVKTLENVPRGHGNNIVSLEKTSILLNPEANREEMRYWSSAEWGPGTLMASLGELGGFLRDHNLLVYKSNNIDRDCYFSLQNDIYLFICLSLFFFSENKKKPTFSILENTKECQEFNPKKNKIRWLGCLIAIRKNPKHFFGSPLGP